MTKLSGSSKAAPHATGSDLRASCPEVSLKKFNDIDNHVTRLNQRADHWFSGEAGRVRWECYIDGRSCLRLHIGWPMKLNGSFIGGEASYDTPKSGTIASNCVDVVIFRNGRDHAVLVGVVGGDYAPQEITHSFCPIVRAVRLDFIKDETLEFVVLLGKQEHVPGTPPFWPSRSFFHFWSEAKFEALPFLIERENDFIVGNAPLSRKRAHKIIERGTESAKSIADCQGYFDRNADTCLQFMRSIRRIRFDPYATAVCFDETFPNGADLVNVYESSPCF